MNIQCPYCKKTNAWEGLLCQYCNCDLYPDEWPRIFLSIRDFILLHRKISIRALICLCVLGSLYSSLSIYDSKHFYLKTDSSQIILYKGFAFFHKNLPLPAEPVMSLPFLSKNIMENTKPNLKQGVSIKIEKNRFNTFNEVLLQAYGFIESDSCTKVLNNWGKRILDGIEMTSMEKQESTLDYIFSLAGTMIENAPHSGTGYTLLIRYHLLKDNLKTAENTGWNGYKVINKNETEFLCFLAETLYRQQKFDLLDQKLMSHILIESEDENGGIRKTPSIDFLRAHYQDKSSEMYDLISEYVIRLSSIQNAEGTQPIQNFTLQQEKFLDFFIIRQFNYRKNITVKSLAMHSEHSLIYPLVNLTTQPPESLLFLKLKVKDHTPWLKREAPLTVKIKSFEPGKENEVILDKTITIKTQGIRNNGVIYKDKIPLGTLKSLGVSQFAFYIQIWDQFDRILYSKPYIYF